jgi:hypothetical protein
MALLRLTAGNQLVPVLKALPAVLLVLFAASMTAAAQTSAALESSSSSSDASGTLFALNGAPAFPDPPDPQPIEGGGREHFNVTPSAEQHQQPFSRIGIGADVSLLGIGIKEAIVLDQTFDARLMENFFSYTSSRFEVEGFNVNANLHLASTAASLDWYPMNSIWRLSPGVMFYNGNQMSGTINVVPGTSFSLNNQTFYSASANPATGATPLAGTGVLKMYGHQPALTLAGGFGRFIPRSERHWSFPSEFGVVLIGAPTISVNTTGWVCSDYAQTQCSNLADATNPVGIAYNTQLKAQLAKWQNDLNKVTVYPIFTYSVVYSFDIR